MEGGGILGHMSENNVNRVTLTVRLLEWDAITYMLHPRVQDGGPGVLSDMICVLPTIKPHAHRSAFF